MKITEPSTMVTDYLISVFTIYLSINLFGIISDENQYSVMLFGISFISTAYGALAGGTSHGFKENISPKTNNILWKTTTISIGIASAAMLAGAGYSSLRKSNIRKLLFAIILIKLVGYIVWMYYHDDFKFVIMDYLPSMFMVILLKLYSYLKFNDPSSIWIILAILVAFLGAGIQLSGVALHKHFNHNDIFHVVQIISMYLFYRGVLLVRDL